MPKTVIQYVLGRLKDIGIDDVFAVAGDFAFPIHDAIVQDPDINYIGCCNELNAGYAADGYARIHGVGAGAQPQLQAFIDASGLPFATMFSDKSVLEEQQPSFIGMYDGRLMNPDVRAYVESCDQVVTVGTLMTDFNTGAFTARLDPAKTIAIRHHYTSVGPQEFHDVEMGDVLRSLASRVKRRGRDTSLEPTSLGPVTGDGHDAITAEALYPRWAEFLRPDDIVVTETGTSSMGLAFAPMPRGATFHNQTLWGAIGWATPAAFGAAVAAPDRRVVLITGERSHQA